MREPSSPRPAPFSAYTTPEFWDDPHVSAQMLALHLDPDASAASRPHAFVDRSVAWLVDELRLRAGDRVLDLGREHDAALLLYEDFCALSPAQRGGLLRCTREALRPGGAFVMDVTAAPRFATEHLGERHERDLDGAGGETRARRDLLHPHRRWSVSGS